MQVLASMRGYIQLQPCAAEAPGQQGLHHLDGSKCAQMQSLPHEMGLTDALLHIAAMPWYIQLQPSNIESSLLRSWPP